MKKIGLLITLFTFTAVISHAQVLVGTATSSINSSAQLEVSSTSKGFLPPRMTRTELNAIASPTPGLLVYCTDCGPKGKVQIYNGVIWTNPNGTSSALNLPSITTFPIADTTITTANSGAVVTNTGGSNILFKGVCWSTHKNPTLADSARIGNDSLLILHSLQPNTTYYVRAVAANAVGIAYGNQLEFKTKKLSLYDHYAGGIVFYLSEENNIQHGAVVSETDIYFRADTTAKNWNSIVTAYQGYGYTDWVHYNNFSIPGKLDVYIQFTQQLFYVTTLPGFLHNQFTQDFSNGKYLSFDYYRKSESGSFFNNYFGSNYLIGISPSSIYDPNQRGYSNSMVGRGEGPDPRYPNSGDQYKIDCYPSYLLGHLRAFRSF